ncbi:MAG: four helix bundle protein [Acidobacteriota bacterium]|nr:four helix bundle protein [Acidobacteriota bacterium]
MNSAQVKSFRDLKVWQKAIQMTVTVYQLTAKFPKEELYGLTSQMRRSAVSIPSNIAEGHGRLNTPEYRQFLGIARGSNFELQTQLEICKALDLGSRERLEAVESLSHEVGKMIFGILESIR